MKLIYCYIEEYRNIKEQEYCFDKRYKVQCIKCKDNHYEVSIEDSKNDWNIMRRGNVENITALVGRNGAGKTSWILLLSELLESYETSSFILIYQDENDYYIECNNVYLKDFNGDFHSSHYKDYLSEVTIFKVNYDDKSFEELEKGQERTKKIAYIMVRHKVNELTSAYANAFYSWIPRHGLKYSDRSIYYKFQYLYRKKLRAREFENKHLELRIKIDPKMKWLLDEEKKINLIPIHFPDKECFFDSMPEGTSLYKKAAIFRLIEIVVSHFRGISKDITINYCKQMEEFVNTYNHDISNMYADVDYIINIVCELYSKLMEEKVVNSVDVEVCFREYLYCIKDVFESIPEACFLRTTDISIPFTVLNQDGSILEKIETLLKYFDLQDIFNEYPDVINYEILGLSDGYEFISNLYGAIYSAFKLFLPINGQKIILVLDEPDCYLHPEWSRRFITDIYSFLQEEFPQYLFEIILTTHSPYILTDLPSCNMIFLEKGVVKNMTIETFGQNIHTLLRNAFFLDSTTGEFSLSIIKELYSALQSIKDSKSESYSVEKKTNIWNTICIVGEPIIQRKLEKMYFECFPEEKDNIIESYRKEIIDLKQRIREME